MAPTPSPDVRTSASPDTVEGSVTLRLPVEGDRAEFERAVRASEQLHEPWVDLADDSFDRLLARNRTDSDRSLLVCRTDDGAIAGVFNLSQIFHGPFRNAYLGYYAFEPHAGHGLMAEGLRLVLGFAFGELGLHRLQANIQPGNEASIALVRGAGFRREGFAPRYLMIGGRWRDHELWAITTEDLANGD